MTPRPALTLIELLVSIAIIALLIGLIVPAVQSVRSAASRADCSNRLRQLGLAAELHTQAHRQYPTGFVSDAFPKTLPYLGWPGRLLPYLERDAQWRQIEDAFRGDPNPLEFYGYQPHAALLATPISVFTCPADGHSYLPKSLSIGTAAFTTYLGVQGTSSFRKNGVFFADSKVTPADITDGLSNTLLFAERPAAIDFRLGWWYRGWGLNKDGTAEMLMGVRERNFSPDYPDCPSGPYHFERGKHGVCDSFHFWSFHPGGANFAFADGSVRFLRYSADSILPALSTRAGGEVAGLD